MPTPLMIVLRQFGARRGAPQLDPGEEIEHQISAPIFLVMRRMRAPLITLIVLFSISVIGLSLAPGVDGDGNPVRMSLFDSFYVISYTATTIGFGEIPWPFTAAQRLWVTICIYLSVVGWAYAIGTLLTLVQDRAFRQALAMRRFTGQVRRLREPFLLMAGYGQAGRLLVQDFDALGQRVVVLDRSAERIDALDLEALHADVPGLAADAANPRVLRLAGLSLSNCSGVLALTDNDETNLSIAMTVGLLRPDVQVIARTVSTTIADRMHAFGTPAVVNPFDRFGDHLRLALRAPATYQLLTWLEAGPGAGLPPRGTLPPDGRWVICGYGRFGRELTRDLREAGLEVVIIEASGAVDCGPGAIIGDGSELRVLAAAGLDTAVGVVAGTDNDTTNLSVLANARKLNPGLFLAARQNQRSNTALFQAMTVDALLVPTEVVAHEVYAQVSTPLLWRFLQEMPARGDAWAAELVDRLHGHCGQSLPALWRAELDLEQAPALVGAIGAGGVTIGDLLRSPEDRERRLRIVPLLLLRVENEAVLCPPDDFVVAVGDELLFAGEGYERREFEFTMVVDSTAEYVLFDRYLPSSLIWRKLSRSGRAPGTGSERKRDR